MSKKRKEQAEQEEQASSSDEEDEEEEEEQETQRTDTQSKQTTKSSTETPKRRRTQSTLRRTVSLGGVQNAGDAAQLASGIDTLNSLFPAIPIDDTTQPHPSNVRRGKKGRKKLYDSEQDRRIAQKQKTEAELERLLTPKVIQVLRHMFHQAEQGEPVSDPTILPPSLIKLDESETSETQGVMGYKGSKGDNVIRSFMKAYPDIQAPAIEILFGIGYGRYVRIKEGKLPYQTQRGTTYKSPNQKEQSVQEKIEEFIKTMPVDEGFPCTHRVVNQYVTHVATCSALYSEYCAFHMATMREPPYSFSSFRIKLTELRPRLKFGTKRSDICNICYGLQVALSDTPDQERKREILLRIVLHQKQALACRLFMNAGMRWVAQILNFNTTCLSDFTKILLTETISSEEFPPVPKQPAPVAASSSSFTSSSSSSSSTATTRTTKTSVSPLLFTTEERSNVQELITNASVNSYWVSRTSWLTPTEISKLGSFFSHSLTKKRENVHHVPVTTNDFVSKNEDPFYETVKMRLWFMEHAITSQIFNTQLMGLIPPSFTIRTEQPFFIHQSPLCHRQMPNQFTDEDISFLCLIPLTSETTIYLPPDVNANELIGITVPRGHLLIIKTPRAISETTSQRLFVGTVLSKSTATKPKTALPIRLHPGYNFKQRDMQTVGRGPIKTTMENDAIASHLWGGPTEVHPTSTSITPLFCETIRTHCNAQWQVYGTKGNGDCGIWFVLLALWKWGGPMWDISEEDLRQFSNESAKRFRKNFATKTTIRKQFTMLSTTDLREIFLAAWPDGYHHKWGIHDVPADHPVSSPQYPTSDLYLFQAPIHFLAALPPKIVTSEPGAASSTDPTSSNETTFTEKCTTGSTEAQDHAQNANDPVLDSAQPPDPSLIAQELCVVCGQPTKVGCVQCEKCEGWVHSQCLSTSTEELALLSTFLCPVCLISLDQTPGTLYNVGARVSFYERQNRTRYFLRRGIIRAVTSTNPIFYDVELQKPKGTKNIAHHQLVVLQDAETSGMPSSSDDPTELLLPTEQQRPFNEDSDDDNDEGHSGSHSTSMNCVVCHQEFPEQPEPGTAYICTECTSLAHVRCVPDSDSQPYLCATCQPLRSKFPDLNTKETELGSTGGETAPTIRNVERPIFVAEDASGSIPLPLRSHYSPAADYYSQKLTITAEIFALPVERQCCVHLIDHRLSLKNGNVFCTMRYKFFQWLNRTRLQLPDFYWGVRDNLVKENKSMLVLYFIITLTVLLRMKGGCCCYLLPGHSHNAADRYGAMSKNTLKGKDIFTIHQVASWMRQCASIDCVEIIDEVWDWNVICDFFLRFPVGFTKYYIYTWLVPENGPMFMNAYKYFGDEPTCWKIVDDVNALRSNVAGMLFDDPNVSPQTAMTKKPNLVAVEPRGLTPDKIAAIKNLLFSVPEICKPWYLLYCNELQSDNENDASDGSENDERRKKSKCILPSAPLQPILPSSVGQRLLTTTRMSMGSDSDILRNVWENFGQITSSVDDQSKKMTMGDDLKRER